jgi:hypothetical protein
MEGWMDKIGREEGRGLGREERGNDGGFSI